MDSNFLFSWVSFCRLSISRNLSIRSKLPTLLVHDYSWYFPVLWGPSQSYSVLVLFLLSWLFAIFVDLFKEIIVVYFLAHTFLLQFFIFFPWSDILSGHFKIEKAKHLTIFACFFFFFFFFLLLFGCLPWSSRFFMVYCPQSTGPQKFSGKRH